MGQKNIHDKKRKLPAPALPATEFNSNDDVIDLDAEDEHEDSSASQEFLEQIERAKWVSLTEFQQEQQRASKRSRTEKSQRTAATLAWETFFDVNELAEEILSFVSDAQSRLNLIMVRRSRYEKHSAAEKAQLKWLWKSLRDYKLTYADATAKYQQLIGRMTDTAPLEFVPREKHKMFKKMDRIRGIYSSMLYLAALDRDWIGMGHIVALMNNTGMLKKDDISCATLVANMVEPLLQYTDTGYGFLDYKVNSDKNIINDITEMIFHVPIDTFGFFYTRVFTIGGQRQLYPLGAGTVTDREILCTAGEHILDGLRRLSNGDNTLLLRVVSRLVNVYIDAGSPHGKQVLTSILAKFEKEDIRTLLIANDYYVLRYIIKQHPAQVANADLRDSHSPSTHLIVGIDLSLLLNFILDTIPDRLADPIAWSALTTTLNVL